MTNEATATIFEHTDADGDYLKIEVPAHSDILVLTTNNAAGTVQIVLTYEQAASMAACIADTTIKREIRNRTRNAIGRSGNSQENAESLDHEGGQ